MLIAIFIYVPISPDRPPSYWGEFPYIKITCELHLDNLVAPLGTRVIAVGSKG